MNIYILAVFCAGLGVGISYQDDLLEFRCSCCKTTPECKDFSPFDSTTWSNFKECVSAADCAIELKGTLIFDGTKEDSSIICGENGMVGIDARSIYPAQIVAGGTVRIGDVELQPEKCSILVAEAAKGKICDPSGLSSLGPSEVFQNHSLYLYQQLDSLNKYPIIGFMPEDASNCQIQASPTATIEIYYLKGTVADLEAQNPSGGNNGGKGDADGSVADGDGDGDGSGEDTSGKGSGDAGKGGDAAGNEAGNGDSAEEDENSTNAPIAKASYKSYGISGLAAAGAAAIGVILF